MADTKDYQKTGGIATMCTKYYMVGNTVRPRKDTIECEFEKFDRYHRYTCKYFRSSEMCRYEKKVS